MYIIYVDKHETMKIDLAFVSGVQDRKRARASFHYRGLIRTSETASCTTELGV